MNSILARPFVLAKGLAFSLAGLLLLCTLTYPYYEDCTIYSYMTTLLLHGRFPYVGSWDTNFPGVIVILIPEQLLLGLSSMAFHCYDVVLQSIGLTLLYHLVARYDRRAALLSVILASAYYVHMGFTMAGQRDCFVTVALLAALFILHREINASSVAAAGLLMGWIVLVRPTYVLLPIVLSLAIAVRGMHNRDWWRYPVVLLLWSASLMGTMLVLYCVTGHFHNLWEVILYDLRVYSASGETFSFGWPLHYYYFHLIGIAGVIVLAEKKYRSVILLCICLMGAVVVSIVVTHKFAFYHYHPFMILALGLSSWGWSLLIDRFGTGIKSWGGQLLCPSMTIVLYSLLVLYSLSLTFRGNTITRVLRAMVEGKTHSLEDIYSYYDSDLRLNRTVLESTAHYLNERTKPGDEVQLIGQILYPQYRAGLLSTTRFITIYGLVTQVRDSTPEPIQIEWRREFETGIIASPPSFILLCDVPMVISSSGKRAMVRDIATSDFPDLMQFIAQRYSVDTTIGAYIIYRRLQ